MDRNNICSIKPAYRVLRWVLVVLLLTFYIVLVVSVLRATGRDYFNLDVVCVLFLITGFLSVVWAAHMYRQTTYVQLLDDAFVIKKVGRRPATYPYEAIVSHNERLTSDRYGAYHEFAVYMADNWFDIRSNDFPDYDYLNQELSRHGKPGPYRDVITPAERTRLGWFISAMALLIAISIGFGFALHNPADPNPAQLIALTDIADQVNVNRNKGRLVSVTIRLRAHPNFYFEVSRRQFDNPPDGLQAAIRLKQPITLLIRQSEFRKKLIKTEPLTFGDKYDGYKEIKVFGVRQGDSVNLQTSQPILEPTHTNPLLRTLFLGLLLVFCWAGWVYVEQLEVLDG